MVVVVEQGYLGQGVVVEEVGYLEILEVESQGVVGVWEGLSLD